MVYIRHNFYRVITRCYFRRNYFSSINIRHVSGKENLNHLLQSVNSQTKCKKPHPGLLICYQTFEEPYPTSTSVDYLTTCVLNLLLENVYPILGNIYVKFNIILSFKRKSNSDVEVIHTTLGGRNSAIVLADEGGGITPQGLLYQSIHCLLSEFANTYDDCIVTRLTVRIYLGEQIKAGAVSENKRDFSLDERVKYIFECQESHHSFKDCEPIKPRPVGLRNRKYPEYITSVNNKVKGLTPFLVADTETILYDGSDIEGDRHQIIDEINKNESLEVHSPYAIGVMIVRPGQPVQGSHIDCYYSSDYPEGIFPSHYDRSQRLLRDFFLRIVAIVKQNPKLKVVYFHNFSRFDGIMLVKHITLCHKNLKIEPLLVNGRIFQAHVYEHVNVGLSNKEKVNIQNLKIKLNKDLQDLPKDSEFRAAKMKDLREQQQKQDKFFWKKLFTFRDSMHLLPGSLNSLAKALCPELGSKGEIDHSSMKLESISSNKEEVINYMKQDIRLLGGVLQKAQDIYFNNFKLDITDWVTISSIALGIFRSKYLNDKKYLIHIPNMNADTFIRKGYYGGHADAYIPKGENLYYYDVNSLYPFIMKEFPMPGGKPVWNGNLTEMSLDSLFGFIEAYVVCPPSMNRPFLPYRSQKDPTLIFPIGEWIGVYYTEELKYAKELGYEVVPIRGYLYQKMESPFQGYVTSLFENRLEAKKEGKEALSFVYKLLMNSLYGRFGINPISSKCDIIDSREEYNMRVKLESFTDAYLLGDDKYIINYKSNIKNTIDKWDPPKNSAVQIAAAITANARIHMYKYINHDDCYYTDTDSVVLGHPLPEAEISSTELGKLKLEDHISKGLFLAPKSYYYCSKDEQNFIKYKGAGKVHIKKEWFETQYENPEMVQEKDIDNHFRVNLKKLDVYYRKGKTSLGLSINNKREQIFLIKGTEDISTKWVEGSIWVGSQPKKVSDFSALDALSHKLVIKLQNLIKDKTQEVQELKNKIEILLFTECLYFLTLIS